MRNISGPNAPMRTVWRTQSGTSASGISAAGRPALQHDLGNEALEVGQHEQVGVVAGRDRAEVREAVPERGAERRADERVLGRDAERDRVAHHRVDVAVVGDVLRLAVVGAERDPRRPVLGEQRQQRLQVARGRALADQQPHPGAQPLASLLGGVRLVVGADPGRRVRLQVAAEHARARGRRRARRAPSFASSAGAPLITPGKFIISASADHAPPAQQRVEVARAQLAAAATRSCDAGTHDDAMK